MVFLLLNMGIFSSKLNPIHPFLVSENPASKNVYMSQQLRNKSTIMLVVINSQTIILHFSLFISTFSHFQIKINI